MGSRALKKFLKNDLESLDSSLDESSESEFESNPQINPFDLLNSENLSDNDEIEDEDRDDDKDKDREDSDKGKKDILDQSAKNVNAVSKKSKKKNKKSKKKLQTQQNANYNESDHELDQLIAEFHTQNIQESEDLSYIEYLKVDTRSLDYEREYKQLFGKSASQGRSSTTTDSMNLSSSLQKPRDWGGKDGKTIPGTSRKLILTRIKDRFPPVNRRDILMEQLTGNKYNGIREFKFTHSTVYMEAEKAFQVLSTVGDLDVLVSHTLKETPYHVSTLLLLSDVKITAGQYSDAGELIEQCLLVYDRGFRTNFDVTSGTCRLPFRYYENRGFYLTIFKYLKILMRRGTWNTAFEFNKLLWSLEPEDDPLGAGFMIDFFAINAGMCQYILDLEANEYFTKKHYSLRPNILYSRALAYHQKYPDQSEKIIDYVIEAVTKFPWVAAAILDGEGAQSPIYGVKAGPEQAIYSKLYATQMKTFWQGDIRQILLDVCQRLDLKLKPIKQAEGVSINVARFALLSEQTEVYSLIPKEYLSNTMFANDVLPPLDNISPFMP